MKKSFLFNVFIFTCGVAVGFLCSKSYHNKYYSDLAQEEIDSVKETFYELHQTTLNRKNKDNMNDEKYDERIRTNLYPLTRSSLNGNPYEQAKRNYNLVRHNDEAHIPENTDEDLTKSVHTVELAPEITVDRTKPYIIDNNEFTDEFDSHDKISLYYYRIDDVLCDEEEEVVEDIEGTIGYDALAALDKQTTIWVRNEPLCTDYEIVAINRSYTETVKNVEPKKCKKCGKELNLVVASKYDTCRECSKKKDK
jgi:hypothetical protein